MSDPYNSAGPPANTRVRGQGKPQSAAAAPPATRKLEIIDQLNVSPYWRRRFRAIEKAGGPALPDGGELTARERASVGMNLLAWFFGPFYFLVKGLWRTALLMSGVLIAMAVMLLLLGAGEAVHFFVIVVNAAFATRANVIFYRRVVLDENVWA